MNNGEEAKHFCTEVNEHGEVCGGQLDLKIGYLIEIYQIDDAITAYPCMKCKRLYRYQYPLEKSGPLIPAFRLDRPFSLTGKDSLPYFLIEFQGRNFPDFYWNDEDKKRGKSSRMGDHFYEQYVRPTLKE